MTWEPQSRMLIDVPEMVKEYCRAGGLPPPAARLPRGEPQGDARRLHRARRPAHPAGRLQLGRDAPPAARQHATERRRPARLLPDARLQPLGAGGRGVRGRRLGGAALPSRADPRRVPRDRHRRGGAAARARVGHRPRLAAASARSDESERAKSTARRPCGGPIQNRWQQREAGAGLLLGGRIRLLRERGRPRTIPQALGGRPGTRSKACATRDGIDWLAACWLRDASFGGHLG